MMKSARQILFRWVRLNPVFALGLACGVFCLAQSTSDFKNSSLPVVQSSADGGNALAQYELGFRYMVGKGGRGGNETNFVEAAAWLQMAADQGLPIAQHNLAGLYYSGFGTPRDYSEAIKWYKKAAVQGFSPAQSFLGWAYSNGKGVEESYQEAIKWYTLAANDNGDKEAQLSLGLLYLKGEDLNPDYVEAYKWINIAAAQGQTNAVKIRQTISLSMTPDQITEGQRRAAAFALGNESPTGELNGLTDAEKNR